jgi:hypothetical protein
MDMKFTKGGQIAINRIENIHSDKLLYPDLFWGSMYNQIRGALWVHIEPKYWGNLFYLFFVL